MSEILSCMVAAVAGYLLGSISTGLIVAKNSSHVDLRKEGSKSTGATNVLRVLGKKPAAITFVGDFLKVLLAMIIGSLLYGQYGAMVAGLAGIIGHNWPIYHQFKGGKGVASSVAVMLYIFPLYGVIALIFFFALVALTKYISLGSMAMLALFALLVIISNFNNWLVCLWAVAVAALCIFRHRANIVRLLKGTENKLTLKRK
jgi:acyl phosphate:glycerol-3-phosphate acyltransferase